MAEVIQCPQCDKKFRLPDNPPATFTCSQCSTLMDLSDFGGRDEPDRSARFEDGGTPRTRKQRRGGGGGGGGGGAPSRSRGGAPARGGGRRRGGGAQAAEHDDSPAGRRAAARAKKNDNNGVMIGAIVGLVVVVALVAVIMSTKDDESTSGDKTTTADGSKGMTKAPSGLTSDTPGGTAGTGMMPGVPAVPVPGGVIPGGVVPAGSTPAKGGPSADEAAAEEAKRKRFRAIGRTSLQKFDWPEGVDAETRTQVDQAIQDLYRGGRDGNDAREFLQKQGRIIGGRLVSEFKALEESPGFGNREGASLAGTIDQVLRSIDGWMERRWHEERQIKATSQPSFILRIAKRWTAWWATDEWKNKEREPWDPRVDSQEAEAAKKAKKNKKKGTGYTKRAGG